MKWEGWNTPGHPHLFGTTEEFLRRFGVASLEELPNLNPEQVEEMKTEAEEEAEMKLDVSCSFIFLFTE